MIENILLAVCIIYSIIVIVFSTKTIIETRKDFKKK